MKGEREGELGYCCIQKCPSNCLDAGCAYLILNGQILEVRPSGGCLGVNSPLERSEVFTYLPQEKRTRGRRKPKLAYLMKVTSCDVPKSA